MIWIPSILHAASYELIIKGIDPWARQIDGYTLLSDRDAASDTHALR